MYKVSRHKKYISDIIYGINFVRGHSERTASMVILLQVVMVNPGTHLDKNHKSLSITNESHFKNKESM